MQIGQAITILQNLGIKIIHPIAGIYFAEAYQVRESEIIKWALILDRRNTIVTAEE